jgi:hypothetical protein
VHVTIDGVRFGGGFYDCIHSLYECDQLEIVHCSTTGTLGRAVVYLSNDHATNGISPSAGILISQCHFANMDSTTSGDALYAIYLMGTENGTIRNCVLRGHDHLIFLTGTTSVRNDGLTVDGVHAEINQELKDYDTERWAPSTVYAVGDFVRPGPAAANGWWYKCTQAGTSAANTTTSTIRSVIYRWVASARGTDEYYCELAGGGDPSLTQPLGVMVSGDAQTFSFPGKLNDGEWGWGNNDSLGFNTIYIRLAGGTADPDSLAAYSIWTTDQEPTWPTTYGVSSTSPDGSVTWTAHKQSIVVNVDATATSISGGLRLNSVWGDSFCSFIHMQQNSSHDTARVYVNACTIRTTDMVFNQRNALRTTVLFENSQLGGCIKPFTSFSASNNQSMVLKRYCSHSDDYTGALGNAVKGVASWNSNESDFSYDSWETTNDTSIQHDLRMYSHIAVATGSSGSAVTVYMPNIISTTFQNGLRGKTVTITHASGSDGLTISFPTNQAVLSGGAAPTTLSLPAIGDSVTLRFGLMPTGGTIRWMVVGSHGI